MNEQEWLLIEEVFPVHKIRRPREYGNREIMNAIRYQQHANGICYRMTFRHME
jgi:hypothetical protein